MCLCVSPEAKCSILFLFAIFIIKCIITHICIEGISTVTLSVEKNSETQSEVRSDGEHEHLILFCYIH